MAKQGISMEELKVKSIDELAQLGEDRRAELFALRFQAATGSLEKTHRIKVLKVEIARIEMLLGDKRSKGEVAKVQKANYSEAVEKAEKAGKEVRKKQREMIEKMQQEQSGVANTESAMGSEVSDDMIQKAMEAAMDQAVDGEKAETKPATKPAAAKPTAKAATTKPAAAKPATEKHQLKNLLLLNYNY
jgi:colicin import membrane protein